MQNFPVGKVQGHDYQTKQTDMQINKWMVRQKENNTCIPLGQNTVIINTLKFG